MELRGLLLYNVHTVIKNTAVYLTSLWSESTASRSLSHSLRHHHPQAHRIWQQCQHSLQVFGRKLVSCAKHMSIHIHHT